MAFYYFDPERGRLGPCSLGELRRLFAAGAITLETRISLDGSEASVPFQSVREQVELAQPGSIPPPLPAESRHGPGVESRGGSAAEDPLTSPAGSDAGDGSAASASASAPASGGGPPPLPRPDRAESFTGQAREDIRVMLPHLTLPLGALRSFRWLENRRALAIAAVGLLPLAIYAVFRQPWQLGNAYWAMALYFSTLWALFFYYAFRTPEAEVRTAALCFFTTSLVSVSALLIVYRIWPLSDVPFMIRSDNWLLAWFGFVFGVGVPEEFCKALVLFIVLWRRGPLPPQSLLFYGVMSGLGFGIYEGVKYQTLQNFDFAIRAAGEPNARFAAEYYLLNLVRLTTLPFLHAIWTGMAGYFIGFAGQYPERQRGLVLVAIGLPAFLHGTYNTFGGALGMIVALISVLALNLYLAKSVEFEQLLKDRR